MKTQGWRDLGSSDFSAKVWADVTDVRNLLVRHAGRESHGISSHFSRFHGPFTPTCPLFSHVGCSRPAYRYYHHRARQPSTNNHPGAAAATHFAPSCHDYYPKVLLFVSAIYSEWFTNMYTNGWLWPVINIIPSKAPSVTSKCLYRIHLETRFS
jgi:hypothetical protein